MNYHKDLQQKYDHALDRIFGLFKAGRDREIELENALELARDELKRILACPGADSEIKQLCERGLRDTRI